MRDNRVQFAVVREDPSTEAHLLRATGARRVLLVGSGGCTALSLQAMFPATSFCVVDPNDAQLALIQRKMAALRAPPTAERNRSFNVGDDDERGWNACGNFESLFRSLRRFLNELVLDREGMTRLFSSEAALAQAPDLLFAHKYWTVAFELHFHSSFLEAMFGPQAIQHAPPQSYATYFREVFEKGILRHDARRNYFLHHVFLGSYLDDPACLPFYLTAPAPDFHFDLAHGPIDSVRELDTFDVVSFSNIFDWMAEEEVARVAEHFTRYMKPASAIVFRQLNHQKDFASFFGQDFRFDDRLGEALLAKDRSLFYSKIHVATRK